jgi:GT2 family glycosyltransferase
VARNRALAESSHPHVAFTDDDVTVDPLWLRGVAQGFARHSHVACVTGPVVAARLDTDAQRHFEGRAAWAASFSPRLFDLERNRDSSPLYPFSGGLFGTGANLSVDRDFALELGGFDEALGAGSASRGGEDFDFFVRVLRAGGAIAYEPAALVWHHHRASASEVREQLGAYGVGLAAYLTKHLSDGSVRREMLRAAPGGVAHMFRLWRRGHPGGQAPKGAVRAEVIGLLSGPFAYRRARRTVRDRASRS